MGTRLRAVRYAMRGKPGMEKYYQSNTFAERLGMSQSSISRMELGQVKLTPRFIRSLATEFNVNPDWITEGKEPMFLPATSQTMAKRVEALLAQMTGDQAMALCDFLEIFLDGRDDGNI